MQTGDEVPDFELPDQNGTMRRLSTMLVDGPVVLFFYPAALTTGCTKEACHFRDLAAEFAAAGAQRIGISLDSVTKQGQFADKHRRLITEIASETRMDRHADDALAALAAARS